MKLFNKILIANRGEIAVRVMKTAKKMGIQTVSVYSRVDSDSLHVGFADESYCIGEVELSDTYLNIQKIVDVAKRAKCDAIHPGYGFLAENSLFVKSCDDAGIVFIGPTSRAMKMMGNKIEARAFAKKIKIPITEGITGDIETLMNAEKFIAYPLLVKAAAGGGGKGMHIVRNIKELASALETAGREAKSYFGDETIYIEKYIEEPRHIEVQIIGDNHGNVIHLFERECSIQRRYQKIIEESPSPTLTNEIRKKMGESAVRIGKEIGYNNAGTIEFLVDKDLNYYFLEMNTRIQVEHPVTEMVTGIDIVEEQIYIAAGNELRLKQEDISQKGHAIECRIYAEDPANKFLPSPGKMSFYKEPALPGIRIDTGITSQTEIKSFFDPMICKLIVWADDRNKACNIMTKSLQDYIIHGIKTNISYLIKLLRHDAFITNHISTKFCDEYTGEMISEIQSEKEQIPEFITAIGFILYCLKNRNNPVSSEYGYNVWNAIGFWRSLMSIRFKYKEKEISVNIDKIRYDVFEFDIAGKKYSVILHRFDQGRINYTVNDCYYHGYVSEDSKGNVFVSHEGHIFNFSRLDILTGDLSVMNIDSFGEDSYNVFSPMPGKVIKINVKKGDKVKKGEILMVIEAMKMENNIAANKDAVVEKVNISLGKMVDGSIPLIIFEKVEK